MGLEVVAMIKTIIVFATILKSHNPYRISDYSSYFY